MTASDQAVFEFLEVQLQPLGFETARVMGRWLSVKIAGREFSVTPDFNALVVLDDGYSMTAGSPEWAVAVLVDRYKKSAGLLAEMLE